ncbi:MAG: DUF2152 domain-containing protein [Desulfobacteraceae bacterium]|nr:DUF2152 domain-containing protein [Desulfobacteraceae bacterium]
MHEHGHHLAGLPASFWILLALLILLFHLFLIKLVYNEWIRYDRSVGPGGAAGNAFFARLATSRTRYAM